MLENYHTHTPLCRHATGNAEEYVLCAIKGGLKDIGFSDHTPFLFPDGYYSHMRMYPDQIQQYAETILALKEKYADVIHVHLGLEVEYYPDRMEALLKLIEPYGIEYMILGQHWCGNEQNEPYNGAATNDETHLIRYCDQIIAAMDTGLFSYIAHPDLLHFVGDENQYRFHMQRLCQKAKDENMPLEINLLGLRGQRHYPREAFWETAGEVGCKAVLGCDAHTPEDVVDPLSEKTARLLAEKYQLELLEHVPIHPYI